MSTRRAKWLRKSASRIGFQTSAMQNFQLKDGVQDQWKVGYFHICWCASRLLQTNKKLSTISLWIAESVKCPPQCLRGNAGQKFCPWPEGGLKPSLTACVNDGDFNFPISLNKDPFLLNKGRCNVVSENQNACDNNRPFLLSEFSFECDRCRLLLRWRDRGRFLRCWIISASTLLTTVQI